VVPSSYLAALLLFQVTAPPLAGELLERVEGGAAVPQGGVMLDDFTAPPNLERKHGKLLQRESSGVSPISSRFQTKSLVNSGLLAGLQDVHDLDRTHCGCLES